MQPALESVLAELVLGPGFDSPALVAVCQRHALSAPDTAALCESIDRLRVYRDLVRGNLREALQLSIPRSMARLGDVFEEYFDRFLLERSPRTHYLRDVTPELLDFCMPLWGQDPRVPEYLGQLALHESLQIQVSALPTALTDRGPGPAPLTLEQGVELSAALRLVQYDYAVHELPEAESDRSAPSRRPVALLAYRNAEHEVRYLELTPLARAIVERLLAGTSLGGAVEAAATAENSALTPTVLAGAAKLLADLAERGVVRGPRPLIPG